MDSKVVLILLGTLVASGSALVCYMCDGTGDDCVKNYQSLNNNTETCGGLNTRCAVTYSKLNGDYVTFSRGCATSVACVCLAGDTGACKRCCSTDRCNTSGSSTAQAQGMVALLAAAILSMFIAGKQ
ncbi:prostate stem cell antigen-like [Branchiostoma floridae]|uniref:Prostate stem cell antigen-like n=1 Tax=Branchiostoma floridae TaxID=7739 RepID=A0A9J7MPW4_BRAFL|nr:prostate stem cell antigen-like [Branchiostoma floridae]